jgi:hypothetical protein
MEVDPSDETSEKRRHELVRKRAAVGLSDDEANELGRLLAQMVGNSYSSAEGRPHPDQDVRRGIQPRRSSLGGHASDVISHMRAPSERTASRARRGRPILLRLRSLLRLGD